MRVVVTPRTRPDYLIHLLGISGWSRSNIKAHFVPGSSDRSFQRAPDRLFLCRRDRQRGLQRPCCHRRADCIQSPRFHPGRDRAAADCAVIVVVTQPSQLNVSSQLGNGCRRWVDSYAS